ncbi:MAG TPA: hypothetical protein VHR45_12915 [Thermoanaerobaculia bacterium]|nr:hypothetical protein [Thermoanaerobaculia bacterium]
MRVILGAGHILVVALGILGGCGMLLRSLLPWRARPFLPLLAPFLGLALISGICHALGVLGLPLAHMTWLFIGLTAVGWGTALIRRRLRWPPREILMVLAICSLAFLLAALPLLSLGYLTTVGSTLDAVSYATRAEYLQHAALRPPDPAPGQTFLAAAQAGMFLRAGDVYLVGLLGLLTGHRSFELLTLVMALFFALTPGTVFVWARLSLRLSQRTSLLASGLVAINNLLLWAVLGDFLGQVIGLSLFPLLLVFGVEGWRRRGWRTAAVFGVFLATLASIYPVFAVYAVVAMFIYWLVEWIRLQHRWRDLPRRASWWLTMAGCAVLANGVAFYRSFTELSRVAKLLQPEGAQYVGPGDILVFPNADEIAGLISHRAAQMGQILWSFPRGATIVLALVALGYLVYGWWKLAPRSRVAAGILLLVSAALAAQQRFGVNLPHGYPYGYFKAVSLIPLEALVLLAAGLAASWRRPALRAVTGLAALAIVALNLMNTAWTLRHAREDCVVVTRELIGVGRAAAAAPAAAWILLDVSGDMERLWIQYLWRDQLRLADRRAPRPAPHAPFFRWALVEKQLDEKRRPLGEPWYDPAQYVVAWQDDRFALRRRRDAILATMSWEAPVLRPSELLDLELTPERQTMQGKLAERRDEAELAPGTPSLMQIIAFGTGSTPARLEVDGAAPLALGTGGWLLELELACRPDPNRVKIRNIGDANVLLSEIKVLSSVPDRPHACFGTTPLEMGVAYVEQEVAAPRIRYKVLLWNPRNADNRLYKLGICIANVTTGRLFGAWSVPFAAGERAQRGSLEIDLRGRRSQAEVDGRPIAALDVLDPDPGIGSFAISSVVWQLNPLAQVSVNDSLWFERTSDGSITITAASSHAPLTAIFPR